MSDVQEKFYILVGDGPLVGPFGSEESAKEWAAENRFPFKWVDEVLDWHTIDPTTLTPVH